MDYLLQDNTTQTMLPSMKRARLLITMALFVEFVQSLVFGLFQFKLLAALNWNHATLGIISASISFLINIITIAGYIQFCFTGNKIFRTAGIMLSLCPVTNYLLYFLSPLLFGHNQPLYLYTSIPLIIEIIGLSMLWLSVNEHGQKIIITIFSVLLVSIGYNLMSTSIFNFAEYSNPLAYFICEYHDNCTSYTEYHFINSLILLTLIVSWWQFCSKATIIHNKESEGLVHCIISRPFIAFVICWVMMYGVLNFFSKIILS